MRGRITRANACIVGRRRWPSPQRATSAVACRPWSRSCRTSARAGSWTPHGRTRVLVELRRLLEATRALARDGRTDELAVGLQTLLSRLEERLARAALPSLRPGGERHRRGGAHEPGPSSPAAGGGGPGGRDRGLLLEPGARPRDRRARRPRGPRGGAPAEPAGRRGHRGREQLRGRGAPGRQLPRRGARGGGLPRRAGGDRRLVPHPGRAEEGRGAPARGGHHQPHPPGRLRGRPGPRDGHDPPRPPQQLPHRRIHGGSEHPRSRGTGPEGGPAPRDRPGQRPPRPRGGLPARRGNGNRGPVRGRRRRGHERRQAPGWAPGRASRGARRAPSRPCARTRCTARFAWTR